ncbi:MAG: MATE family efflux transporter [Paracoccaceae bacterium]
MQIGAPMSVGIFSVLAIGLADAFFLAWAGETELTAVGFVYPVTVAISAFSVGLSAGANTALSQAHGRGCSDDEIAQFTLHATLFSLSVGLVIALAFWALAPWLFAQLGARDAVLKNVLAYVPFWAASFPILVVTMILNAGFRAAGDGVTASVVMLLTAIINIAATPALIFGFGPVPEMGMAGAGLATLVARTLALALVIGLAIRSNLLALGWKALEGVFASVAEVVTVALPAAMSRAINPLGMAAVTAIVATLGDAAVAGFGAACRVQAIALVPFFALAAGLSPTVGQAWGASDTTRARDAMRAATVFVLAYGVALGGALLLLADPIAAAMTANGAAAEFTAAYLRIVGFSLAGYGMTTAANAAMTGRSRAGSAMALSLARILLIYVPFAFIGAKVLGFSGVAGAAALANILAFWAALVALRSNRLAPFAPAIVSRPADWLSDKIAKSPNTAPVR